MGCKGTKISDTNKIFNQKTRSHPVVLQLINILKGHMSL